jgi:hypothetical protein
VNLDDHLRPRGGVNDHILLSHLGVASESTLLAGDAGRRSDDAYGVVVHDTAVSEHGSVAARELVVHDIFFVSQNPPIGLIISYLERVMTYGRKPHRNGDCTVGLVPSRFPFSLFLSLF